jgi:hypothetical protein
MARFPWMLGIRQLSPTRSPGRRRYSLNGKLDFFGALKVDVGGYIDSQGHFDIRGNFGINIGLGPIHLNAGASLVLSNNPPHFSAAVWGTLDFDVSVTISAWRFSYTVTYHQTLAGFRGQIAITATSAYMAASATFMGITVSGSHLWSLGAPPIISHMESDGTLVLNTGDASNRYGDTRYDQLINESTSVEYDITNDQYVVRSFGVEQRYAHSRVKKIYARGGSGKDSFYISQGVDAVLDIDGGAGNDSFLILGGAPGSRVVGGLGNDEIAGGAVSGIQSFGDDPNDVFYSGNDRFSGGSGDDYIDMGAGNDTVSSGPGKDTIIVRGGTTKIDTGPGGDLILLTPNAGHISITGGTGLDTLRILPMNTEVPLELGDHKLRYGVSSGELVITFNDDLDVIEMSDTAAVTKLVTTTDVNWGSTGLSLYAAGTVDVSGAHFKAADGMLSISANRFVGTFNTEVGSISLESRGNQSSDINVIERDSLRVINDRWTSGGLTTHLGHVSVLLQETESLLSLDSGSISTFSSGNDIILEADDIDFASGDNKVSGTGVLSMMAHTGAQGYEIGGAAQSLYGRDQSTAGKTGFMALGMRDLSALKDGFSEIDIGAKTAGSKMIIGDVNDVTVGEFDFNAKFTDTVKLAADEIVVAGDVESGAAVYTNSRLLEVRKQNF